MSNNISSLRSLEAQYLSKTDGKLSKEDATNLAQTAAKTGSTEDIAALKDMFSHDAFAKGVNPADILKAAHISGPVGHSKIVDISLGKQVDKASGAKLDVTVRRTLGPPEGFRTKAEAIAIARMSALPNAAVVQDPKTENWHAVESSVTLNGRSGTAEPVKPIDTVAMDNVKRDTSLSKEDKYQKLAALEFGVPDDEINVISKANGKKLDPNKINIDLNLSGVNGHAAHTAESGCGCKRMDGTKTAVVLTTARIDEGPLNAATTLFHEGVHVSDNELSRAWVNEFKKTGKGKNIDTIKGMGEFASWLNKQKMPAADRVTVQHFVLPTMAAQQTVVEGRAHAKAFGAAIESNPEAAKQQLISWADYERKNSTPVMVDDGHGGKKAVRDPDRPGNLLMDYSGATDSDVRKALVADLRHRYDTMPPEAQKNFRAAVEEADQTHPGFKLGEALKLPKA